VRGPLNVVALVVLSAFVACPLLAQDDIYTPKPKPPPSEEKPAAPTKQPPARLDVMGRWIADASGSGVCNKGILIEFGSGATGTTLWGNFPGTFTYKVRGTSVSFVTKYTDFFGNPASDVWTGTVSPEGNAVTGSLEGSWGACSFVMRR
jgi:hypothetical protein